MDELGFWIQAQKAPSALAVVEPDGTTHTRGEILSRSNRLVKGLRALGLQAGDTVAMALPNSARVMELFMAIAQAGFRLTPLNWHLAAPEIAYILKDCEAKALFTSERFREVCAQAADEAKLPLNARFMAGGANAQMDGFRPWNDLLKGQSDDPPENRVAGGTMTYTSGTTGNPKGVRREAGALSPEQASTMQAMFLSLFGILPGSAGVHLVQAPLYHTAVINFATNHAHLGHTVVLMDKWTPEGVLERIEKYGVTNTHMVPTQMNRLLKLSEKERARFNVSSLSHVIHGAAPCPLETKKKLLEWWGPCVYEYYAASEGGGTLATPEDWEKKPGTVGKPWPISEIRILDDQKKPCPIKTPGTVWIRMGDHQFRYHRDDKKTDEAWLDGFFTVGDAGYVDQEGYLFLCDRKSDMIISGGVNIYPAEIESVLVTHPKVADVAVFGIPNADWGEEIKAVVEPQFPESAGPELLEELRKYAETRLGKFKIPKTFELTSELPRDPSGKLYKRKLRDPYWEDRATAI